MSRARAAASDSMPQISDTLSPWWPRAVVVVMALGFAVLILLSMKVYEDAPPIPARAVANGEVVFTSGDISAGQAVFLKYVWPDAGRRGTAEG